MNHPAIQSRCISSCIGRDNILKDVSFDVESESITSILGPSGSGKTTLLKTIAGFQPICKGELLINGQSMSRPGFTQSPDKRDVGMVFQDYALFPHLKVLENIQAGRRCGNTSSHKIDRLIKKLQLTHLLNRRPHELSGGQQQRTALARALIAEPAILLLDEPFANLNQDLQVEIGIELIELLREEKITSIMVTHDQNDAMAVSDNIIILMQGRFIQSGTPEELYRRPADKKVASFLSRGSFIKARYIDNNKAQTALGIVPVATPAGNQPGSGKALQLWLHPEDFILGEGEHVEVINHSWRPLDLLVKVRTDDQQELLVKASQSLAGHNPAKMQIRLNQQITYNAFDQ